MPKSNDKTKENKGKIFLDYAASAVPNPSSIHALGVEAKRELETARSAVASVLNARPAEIIFTSGGTESNNLAILGSPKGHIVTTNIEHASIMETCKRRGSTTFVPVEPNGIVDPKKIKKVLRRDTVLVSIMYANNEIGTIQPIREIAKQIRHYNKLNSKKIIFHTDAVQAANYLDLNVDKLGVDMLSLSGSKILGSGRVGMLYKKGSVSISPIMFGGDQEGGLRPGTENLQAIMEFTDALEVAQKIKDKESLRLTKLRDYFIKQLRHSHILKNIGISVNGDLKNRLPNNINITIPNIPGDLLILELSARGIMASAKSACKAGDGKASHVVRAVDPSVKDTDGSVRFSLGSKTGKKDIDRTLKALGEILHKLKKWYD